MGDAFKCVLKFSDSETLFQLEDFKKVDSKIRQSKDFEVVGFVDSGFVSLEKALQSTFKEAFDGFSKISKSLRSNVSTAEKESFFKEKAVQFVEMQKGKISQKAFGEYLDAWKFKYTNFLKSVHRFVEPLKLKTETKTEIVTLNQGKLAL